MGTLKDKVDEALLWVDDNSYEGGDGMYYWDDCNPMAMRSLLEEIGELAAGLDGAQEFLNLAPVTVEAKALVRGLKTESPSVTGTSEGSEVPEESGGPEITLRVISPRGEEFRVGDRVVVGDISHEVIALGEDKLYYQGDGPVTFVPLEKAVKAADAKTLREEVEEILLDFDPGGYVDPAAMDRYLQRLEIWGVKDSCSR